MTPVTKEQIASQLNGREYGNEIPEGMEETLAKNNLFVVFPYSDDNIEFRGAISEEIGAWDGVTVYLNKVGEFWGEEECHLQNRPEFYPNSIEQVWNDKNKSGPWTYKTTIPHAKFTINEDGEQWAEGLVISTQDLV